MSPASIGPVKAMILSTDLEVAAKFVDGLVEAHDGAHSLRDELHRFAKSNRIPV
jgi:phosphotransferase system enzyme I (PtsP)